jgi:hypothetical protein
MSTVNDATVEPTEKKMTDTKTIDTDEEGNGLEKPRKVSEAKLNAIKKAQEARKVKAKERAEKKQKEEELKIAKKYLETKQQAQTESDSSDTEEEIIIKPRKKQAKKPKKKQRIVYVSETESEESSDDEPPKPKAAPKLKREKPIVEKIDYTQEQTKPVKLTWDNIRWG